MFPHPPTSTLFPYTTLFRSSVSTVVGPACPPRKICTARSSAIFGSADESTPSSEDTSVRAPRILRSEEHTSELQSHHDLVCRLLLEKKKKNIKRILD